MRTYERNGVHVDQCTECRGIFLDRGELEKLVDALPDPGVRRLFVDLVRRRGEVDQDTDTELWVIQKYEGG